MESHPTPESVARAALCALGVLSEPEVREFEQHLETGCSSCNAEFYSLRNVVEQLYDASPATRPPEGLREKLLKKIRSEGRRPAGGYAAVTPEGTQLWKRWASPRDNLFLLRAGETGWENTSVPGVSVRNLFTDSDRRYVTMLVRMEAGTSYPSHRHSGFEECYVLEGDLRVAGKTLRAGDYQRAAAESIHGIQSSENGCLLLIVSSTEDELLS